ncbi:NUDIX domain-containing protein [Acutalibacter sp. JLR.KK004]|uniref:NUDIX domain-containing protein n=1 Tax=Acutalibacter sp. JLR.KK004 TaxID=3112622 RepID=UPI002FF0608C
MKTDRTFGAPEPGKAYRSREGAYLLAVQDGLLAVADTPSGWFLPGGGTDPGESHEACICRECLEELGCPARAGQYMGCADGYLGQTDFGPIHAIQFYYAGALGTKSQEPIEPDHTFIWVPVEEAAQKMKLEMQRWAVQKLLEKTGQAGEQWDLYTQDRVLTGETHLRGAPLPEGRYHLVVHIWIRNPKGQFLISQRGADRPAFPLLWECTGGSVVKGEDSLTGALREVKEEVGLDLPPEGGKLIHSEVRGEGFQDILDVWLFDYNGPLALEKATTKEVAQCRWMDKSEIQALYDSGELVPTLGYVFPLL